MRDYHINIFYSEEDGGYIADIPDLEACSAFGETCWFPHYLDFYFLIIWIQNLHFHIG